MYQAFLNAYEYMLGDLDRQEMQTDALHSDIADLRDREKAIQEELAATARESDIAFATMQRALQQRKLDDAAMLQARIVATHPARSESHRELISLCEEITRLEAEVAKSARSVDRYRSLAAPILDLVAMLGRDSSENERNDIPGGKE